MAHCRDILAIGFLVLASFCRPGVAEAARLPDPDDDVVAKIGDDVTITLAELKEYVADRVEYRLRRDRSSAHRLALETMIGDRLMLIDFFDLGMHRDDALLGSIRRSINEELTLAYFDRRHVARFVNEAAIRSAYEEMGRHAVYREIVLYKPVGASAEVLDSIRATVGSIQKAVDSGADFGGLIRRYTQDPRAARSGGYGEPVTWRRSMSTPFGRVVFNLDPADTRTFETRSAYRIVRVEDQIGVDVPPLDSMRADIIKTLRAAHLGTAREEFEREKATLIDSTFVEWNETGLAQITAWSRAPDFYEKHFRDTIRQAIDAGRNHVILTHADGQVDYRDLLRLLEEILVFRSSPNHGVEAVKAFILEALRTEAVARRARALGLEDEVLGLHTASPSMSRRFVQLYKRHMIEDRIPDASPSALRSYYDAHRDSAFAQQPGVSLSVIVRIDESAIDSLLGRHQRGTSFNDLSLRRKQYWFERTHDGDVASRPRGADAALRDVAFRLDEGEVAGPLELEDGSYALVTATARREGRPLRFDEVEDRIEAAFIDYHRGRLEKALVSDLRAKHGATVFQDVFKRILSRDVMEGKPFDES